MKKRQKSISAELIALLASIRDQIEDSFDDFGVEPDGDDDCDENGDDDD